MAAAAPVARRPACLARPPGGFIRCAFIGSHRTGGTGPGQEHRIVSLGPLQPADEAVRQRCHS